METNILLEVVPEMTQKFQKSQEQSAQDLVTVVQNC